MIANETQFPSASRSTDPRATKPITRRSVTAKHTNERNQMNTEKMKQYLGKVWLHNPQPDDKHRLTKSLPKCYDISVSFDIQNDEPYYWVCLFDRGLELAEIECDDISQAKAVAKRLEHSIQKI